MEFRKVILLADDFSSVPGSEEERRLFYVAMTRAKEELVLCSAGASRFLAEAGLSAIQVSVPLQRVPTIMLYHDLTPRDVWLSYSVTVRQQQTIREMREGMPLQLVPITYRNGMEGWEVRTAAELSIGALSVKGNDDLAHKDVRPRQFLFQPGEVTVGSIYRHLDMDPATGTVQQDHFVVLPRIRLWQ